MLLAFLLAQADPAALVERLGSDDIEVRARAQAALAELGPCAEPALDAASRESDPEVAARARALLADVIAPHRREVDREMAHLAAHARLPLCGGVEFAGPTREGALARVTRLIDPEHPFASRSAWGAKMSAEFLRGVRYPDAERWAEIRDKIPAILEQAHEPTCGTCVRRRLETFQVGVKVENARAEDLLGQLENLGDLKIVVAEEVSFDHALTLSARGPLGEVLERLVGFYGWRVRVTDEGLLWVGR